MFAEQWDAAKPKPPELLGQVFTYNDSPNRFGLPKHYALRLGVERQSAMARSWTGIPRCRATAIVSKH